MSRGGTAINSMLILGKQQPLIVHRAMKDMNHVDGFRAYAIEDQIIAVHAPPHARFFIARHEWESFRRIRQTRAALA